MASTKVHFLVQGPVDPGEARGSFLVEGEDLRLADVARAFPFEAPEGQFHFRFKWSPSGDERRFFWLDVLSPRERVPVWEDGTVVTKVVEVGHREAPWSYELAADAPAQAKRQARDFEPDPSLLGSWEDLAPEAAEPAAATAGPRHSLGVPGGSGVAAVISETADVVGKRFTAARDNLNLGHVSRSFGTFLSSAVKAASSYVGGGHPPSDATLRNLDTYARALATHYDASSARHVGLLRRLWAACFPDADFEPQSPRWKTIGFQHTDPASDFRGGGLLSLRALVYFAEKHAAKVPSAAAAPRPQRSPHPARRPVSGSWTPWCRGRRSGRSSTTPLLPPASMSPSPSRSCWTCTLTKCVLRPPRRARASPPRPHSACARARRCATSGGDFGRCLRTLTPSSTCFPLCLPSWTGCGRRAGRATWSSAT